MKTIKEEVENLKDLDNEELLQLFITLEKAVHQKNYKIEYYDFLDDIREEIMERME